MRIASLHVYPLKSAAGNRVDNAMVERRGLAGDRRWMVVDAGNRFVTGRAVGRLATLGATAIPGGLRLSAGSASIDVALPAADDEAHVVQVWRDAVPARDAGDEAAAWLTARFERPLRLVYQHDEDRRPLGEDRRVREGDHVSFADAYPLLLIGTASLDALNARLDAPVRMDRFRPNVVIETNEPFAEDGWASVRLGDVEFAAATRCARCVFTTVDPSTGIRDPDGEPLRTLRAFRSAPVSRKIMFGVNLIPLATGTVSVGDAVATGAAVARKD